MQLFRRLFAENVAYSSSVASSEPTGGDVGTTVLRGCLYPDHWRHRVPRQGTHREAASLMSRHRSADPPRKGQEGSQLSGATGQNAGRNCELAFKVCYHISFCL